MAYLSGNFPGNYYNGDESKALDFMGYFAHQQQQDQALKNQELNREMALEDLFHTRQMNPMNRQAKQLDLDTSLARLPGIQAESAGKVSKQKLEDSIPFEERRLNVLTKLAKETSEAELANESAQIEKWIINPNTPPQVRQQLIEMRNLMKDLYKHKQTLDSRETVADKRTAPRASGGGAKPPAPVKPPKNDLEATNYWQFQADKETDPENKAYLQGLADAARERHRQLMQTKADAAATGKPDIEAITGGAVQTRPGINPAPTKGPVATPPPKASLADVQKMYPGVPPDKLKEAYKRKFGVELK